MIDVGLATILFRDHADGAQAESTVTALAAGAEIASAILAERRSSWPLRTPPERRGILKRYTESAESAMKGAGY